MRFFKGHKEDAIEVSVGDRILRVITIRKERKWWDDRPLWQLNEHLVIESIVQAISPSGDYFCLTENRKEIWVRKQNLAVLEVLEAKGK